MERKYVMNYETMTELENFSAKFEQLRNFIDFVRDFTWQEIINGENPEGAIEKLGCLTEMLSDAAHIRDGELEAVIKKIAPLPDPVKE